MLIIVRDKAGHPTSITYTPASAMSVEVGGSRDVTLSLEMLAWGMPEDGSICFTDIRTPEGMEGLSALVWQLLKVQVEVIDERV